MTWKIDIGKFLRQLFVRLRFHGTYVNNTNYIWRNFA